MSESTLSHTKRDMIADHVIRLVARDGLDAVSLRSVAKSAGVSMGQVQYHFASVADMLLYAIERAMAQLGALVEQRMSESTRDDDLMAPLRAFTQAFLADDPAVRDFLRVLAQYDLWSRKDPRINDVLSRDDPELNAMLADTFRRGIELGVLHPMIDPEREALLFWVTLGTLAVEVALDQRPRDEALDLMRYHLMRLARDPR